MAIDRDSVDITIRSLYDLDTADVLLDPDVARNMANAIHYAAECQDGGVCSWEEWEALHPDLSASDCRDPESLSWRLEGVHKNLCCVMYDLEKIVGHAPKPVSETAFKLAGDVLAIQEIMDRLSGIEARLKSLHREIVMSGRPRP